MKYKKIALIGMMGCGKSTIAQKLSEKIKIPFVELDMEFEKKYNITIKDFFRKFSENMFRKFESELLEDFLKNDEIILSTGGGVILGVKNRELIFNRKVLSIYLKTSQEEIYNRIKYDKTRPLLLGANMKEKIDEILSKREKYYLKADIIIQTDAKSPDEIVEEIVKRIEKCVN